jgi:signal transduction histidine kinase
MKEITIDRDVLNNKVLGAAKYVFLVMGAVSLLLGASNLIEASKYVAFAIFVTVYLIAVSTLFSNRIPSKIKMRILLSLIYTIGLANVFIQGYFSTGPLWLICFTAISASLYGGNRGILAAVLSTLTIVSYAIYTLLTGNYSPIPDATTITFALDFTIDILLISYIASVPITFVFREYNEMIAKERDQKKELEILNDQLRQTNNDLDSFNYAVSHDLRNPLEVIRCFNDLLSSDYGDTIGEEGRKYLKKISSSADSIEDLISGLLELSQVARLPVQREDVNLRLMALEAIDQYREKYAMPGLKITTDASLSAECDERFVKILIDNLVDNAIKYSAKSENQSIEISVDRSSGEEIYCVRDAGIGFTASAEQSVFDPFVRMHSSKEFKGIGIGLSTSKRIVDRHGGKIWLESKPDQGTTVYFTLAEAAN